MPHNAKRKAAAKAATMRVIALTLAALMLVGIVAASVFTGLR